MRTAAETERFLPAWSARDAMVLAILNVAVAKNRTSTISMNLLVTVGSDADEAAYHKKYRTAMHNKEENK